MNENTKSIVWVAVALVAALVAGINGFSRRTYDKTPPIVNTVLFKDFSDPRQATSLEVVKYDEQSAKTRDFRVALVKGQWTIPSKQDYPADAKEHLADAATSIVGLKVLEVASQDKGSHEQYGVIDPGDKDFSGAAGAGMRVVMSDKSSQPLARLIIGKEVPDRSGLRYVRVVEEDPVYVVKIKTDKLSTQFGDWIEKDLLKLNTWDVKTVDIQDYTVDALAGSINHRGQITLESNDSEPKWKIVADKTLEHGKLVSLKLGDDEEVNARKLDDMKSALGDLKIVDVNRKPQGLSQTLRATGELKANAAVARSLEVCGFYFARAGSDYQLFSSEGEVRITTKDGVDYVLRFGGIAGKESDGDGKDAKNKDGKDGKDKDKSAKGKDGKKSETAGLNRYLFVMTELNKEVISKPQFEQLPAEPAKDEKKTDEKKDEKKADGKKDEKKDEKKPDPKAERERIEKENKRKQEEYDAKVKKAEDRVKELNGRFADWYYVISDDVYQKIHLGRKDVVQKKEKKDEKKDAHAAHDHAAHDHGGAMKSPADSPAELNDLKGAMPSKKKDAEPAKKDDAAKKGDAAKNPEPEKKGTEPAKKAELEKKAEPTKKVEPEKKKAEPAKKAEPGKKDGAPVKKVEPEKKDGEPKKK